MQALLIKEVKQERNPNWNLEQNFADTGEEEEEFGTRLVFGLGGHQDQTSLAGCYKQLVRHNLLSHVVSSNRFLSKLSRTKVSRSCKKLYA